LAGWVNLLNPPPHIGFTRLTYQLGGALARQGGLACQHAFFFNTFKEKFHAFRIKIGGGQYFI